MPRSNRVKKSSKKAGGKRNRTRSKSKFRGKSQPISQRSDGSTESSTESSNSTDNSSIGSSSPDSKPGSSTSTNHRQDNINQEMLCSRYYDLWAGKCRQMDNQQLIYRFIFNRQQQLAIADEMRRRNLPDCSSTKRQFPTIPGPSPELEAEYFQARVDASQVIKTANENYHPTPLEYAQDIFYEIYNNDTSVGQSSMLQGKEGKKRGKSRMMEKASKGFRKGKKGRRGKRGKGKRAKSRSSSLGSTTSSKSDNDSLQMDSFPKQQDSTSLGSSTGSSTSSADSSNNESKPKHKQSILERKPSSAKDSATGLCPKAPPKSTKVTGKFNPKTTPFISDFVAKRSKSVNEIQGPVTRSESIQVFKHGVLTYSNEKITYEINPKLPPPPSFEHSVSRKAQVSDKEMVETFEAESKDKNSNTNEASSKQAPSVKVLLPVPPSTGSPASGGKVALLPAPPTMGNDSSSVNSKKDGNHSHPIGTHGKTQHPQHGFEYPDDEYDVIIHESTNQTESDIEYEPVPMNDPLIQKNYRKRNSQSKIDKNAK